MNMIPGNIGRRTSRNNSGRIDNEINMEPVTQNEIDLERNVTTTSLMRKCRENALLIKNISIMDIFLSASIAMLNHYYFILLPMFLFGYFGAKRYNEKYILVFLSYYSIANIIRCHFYVKTILNTPANFRSSHMFTLYFNFILFVCFIITLINGKIYKFYKQIKQLSELELEHLRN